MSTFVEAPAAATQVLKNTQATLSVIFSAGYADAAVTATVTNASGGTVTSGTATKDLTTTGRYTFVLPAQTDVAALTITWSGAFGGITQSLQFAVDIVGALLFTLADLRVFGDAALTDTTRFPDDTLAQKRAEVTDFFRHCCHVSFIPRYDHWAFDSYYQQKLWLPSRRCTKLLSVTVGGVALNPTELAACVLYPNGELAHSNTYFGYWSGWQRQGIVVEYEHGYQQPPPRIRIAGMRLARYELLETNLSDRAISYMTDQGQFVRQSIPGPNTPTGIPIIDSTLARYDQTGVVEVC